MNAAQSKTFEKPGKKHTQNENRSDTALWILFRFALFFINRWLNGAKRGD